MMIVVRARLVLVLVVLVPVLVLSAWSAAHRVDAHNDGGSDTLEKRRPRHHEDLLLEVQQEATAQPQDPWHMEQRSFPLHLFFAEPSGDDSDRGSNSSRGPTHRNAPFIELPREQWSVDRLPGMKRCTIDRIPRLSHDAFMRDYYDKAPVIYGQPFDQQPLREYHEARPTTSDEGDHRQAAVPRPATLRKQTVAEKACRAFATKENFIKRGPIPIKMHSMSGYAQAYTKPWVLDAYLRSLDTHAIDYNDQAKHIFQLFNMELGQWYALRDACGDEKEINKVTKKDSRMNAAGVSIPGLGLPWHWHTEVHGNKIIYGRKRWFISESPAHLMGQLQGTDPNMMPWKWLRDVYPTLSEQELGTIAECTVEAGETIYVPQGFYHQTLNLEPGFFVLYGPGETKAKRKEDDSRVHFADMCSRRGGGIDSLIAGCERAHARFPQENEFLQQLANLHVTKMLQEKAHSGAKRDSSRSTSAQQSVYTALGYAIKAFEANPRDERTLIILATLLFSTQQCEHVIALYTQHIRETNPSDLRSQLLAARCLYFREELDNKSAGRGSVADRRAHETRKYSEDGQNDVHGTATAANPSSSFVAGINQHSTDLSALLQSLDALLHRLEGDHMSRTRAGLEAVTASMSATMTGSTYSYAKAALLDLQKMVGGDKAEQQTMQASSCLAAAAAAAESESVSESPVHPTKKASNRVDCLKPFSNKFIGGVDDMHQKSHDLLVDAIARARGLIWRHPLDISATQTFLAYFSLFQAHSMLGTLDFLLEREVQYLMRPMFSGVEGKEGMTRYDTFLELLKLDSEIHVAGWLMDNLPAMEKDAGQRMEFQLRGLMSPRRSPILPSGSESSDKGLATARAAQSGTNLEVARHVYDVEIRGAFADAPPQECYDIRLAMNSSSQDSARPGVDAWARECQICVISGCSYCLSTRQCVPIAAPSRQVPPFRGKGSALTFCPHPQSEVNYLKPQSQCVDDSTRQPSGTEKQRKAPKKTRRRKGKKAKKQKKKKKKNANQ